MAAIHGRITHVLLALVLLSLLAIIGMLATGVRGGPLDPSGPPASTSSVRLPGTPIDPPSSPAGFPIVINAPGHYYLTGNLNPPVNTRAITISSNDISLDLGGFTLTGTGPGDANAPGILLSAAPLRVTISNGTIRGFPGNGIAASGSQYTVIENVTLTENLHGATLSSNSVIRNCIASANNDAGVLVSGSYSRIENCIVRGNAFVGVSLQNGSGLVLAGSIVGDNNTAGNATGGVALNSVEEATIRDNDIVNNGGMDVVVNFTSDRNVFINNTLDCVTVSGTDNVIPIDTADPGTNYSHNQFC